MHNVNISDLPSLYTNLSVAGQQLSILKLMQKKTQSEIHAIDAELKL